MFVDTTHLRGVVKSKSTNMRKKMFGTSSEDPSSLRRGLSHACSPAARTARAKRRDIRQGKVQVRNLYGKPWLHHSPPQSRITWHFFLKKTTQKNTHVCVVFPNLILLVIISMVPYIIDRTGHLQPCTCHSQISSFFSIFQC